MKNRLYVIFDRVAEESGPIFEAKNDGVAYRMYEKYMDGKDVEREEFKLLKVGTFDHDSNELVAYGPLDVTPRPSMVDELVLENTGDE